MSERAGRPAMERPLAFLSVTQRLDLSGGFDAAIGDDPLEHADSLLQLLDLVAQPNIFLIVHGIATHLAHRAHGNAQFVPDDGEGEHQDKDSKDELEGVHWALSPTGIRACSRSASICWAVWAPLSVTICSSTLNRASKRSMCCAY